MAGVAFVAFGGLYLSRIARSYYPSKYPGGLVGPAAFLSTRKTFILTLRTAYDASCLVGSPRQMLAS